MLREIDRIVALGGGAEANDGEEGVDGQPGLDGSARLFHAIKPLPEPPRA